MCQNLSAGRRIYSTWNYIGAAGSRKFSLRLPNKGPKGIAVSDHLAKDNRGTHSSLRNTSSNNSLERASELAGSHSQQRSLNRRPLLTLNPPTAPSKQRPQGTQKRSFRRCWQSWAFVSGSFAFCSWTRGRNVLSITFSGNFRRLRAVII